jgi:Tfp pilus assembly protein PilN
MTMLRLDYQQKLPFPWAGPALLVLTLTALVLTVAYYVELNSKAVSWEDRLDQIERRQGRASASGPSKGRGDEDMAQEVKRANEVLRQLTLPWDALFKAVESAAGKEIALLALDPNTEKHVVKISGEARDLAALLNYITQLEKQDVFGPVYLQSHQIQQQNPDKPVRFSLLAAWREKP